MFTFVTGRKLPRSAKMFFLYSTLALRHCLAEVYRREPTLQKELIKKVNKGILKNYMEVRAFWDSYENPLEPIFEVTYNNFLKANNQSGGMDSYSYVVALYVNYFKKYPLE